MKVKRQFLSAFVVMTTLFCLRLLPTSYLRSKDTEPDPVATKTDARKASAKVSTVELTFDYGDGMQKRYPTLPWKDGMTVFDALTWAEKHPRGIKISSRGKGSTRLVSQIDDLKNGSAGKKNWIFRINDKLADRSCGVFKLKAADRILWKFDEYK